MHVCPKCVIFVNSLLFRRFETQLKRRYKQLFIIILQISPNFSSIKAQVNEQNVLRLMYHLVVQLTLKLGGQILNFIYSI